MSRSLRISVCAGVLELHHPDRLSRVPGAVEALPFLSELPQGGVSFLLCVLGRHFAEGLLVEALDVDLVGEGLEEVDFDVVSSALLDHGPDGSAGGGFGALDDLVHEVFLEEEGQLGFLMIQGGLKVVYLRYFTVRYIEGVTAIGEDNIYLPVGL